MRPSLRDPFREPLVTWPNVVTVVRVTLGLIVFGYAASSNSLLWAFAGLFLHWGLDGLDGFLARSLGQETRLGAQIDIIADRMMVIFFYVLYLRSFPQFLAPVLIYLFAFAFLDQYLSNQYMIWGLLSPNYFFQVDRRIWRLNWSNPGKFANGGVFSIVLLGTGSYVASLAYAAALTGLKLYTFYSIQRLRLPDAWQYLRVRPPVRPGFVGLRAPSWRALLKT